jgi:DNA (cytosine-5)-methyltransferase 1
MPKQLTSVDLFCGAGGLTEGFSEAGYKCVFATDFDQQALQTFSFNHPEVSTWCGDIRKLDGKELRKLLKPKNSVVDVVAGGPPCQGFSLAGRRLPDDPKNTLFREFLRIVKELRPRAVVFENVSGICSMQGGAVVAAIEYEFKLLGYATVCGVVNSADYGVPQQRPRFILIALADGTHPTLPPPTYAPPSNQATLFKEDILANYISVEEALSDLPKIAQGEGVEDFEWSPGQQTPYQKARFGKRRPGHLYNHRATRHSDRITERYALIPQGCDNSVVPEHLRTKKINVWRLHEAISSRTVTCNFRTDLLNPWVPRGTTVREAARLQSFDDDYAFFGNLTRKAKWVTQDDQVGNAVPPLLARAIGEHLKSFL